MLKVLGSKQIETIEEWTKKHKHLSFNNLFELPHKNARRNFLTIAKGKNGYAKVVYVSKTGKPYTAEFKLSDNPFLLLNYLAHYPNKLFSKSEIKEMGASLNPISRRAFSKDDERRIRDTITSLRFELGLKNKKQDDPFVSVGGFGLMCAIERKI